MRSTIRHLDVVRNPVRAQLRDKPCLVCIQHPLLDHLDTRVMASLVTGHVIRAISRLHPAMEIPGEGVLYFNPSDLFTLTCHRFGPAIANLAAERDRIVAALDLVFTGI